jgi:hypothetical protein
VRLSLYRIRRVRVPVRVFWHSVTNGNCVAVRRGGEQPKVNDQSVTQVNSIRLVVVASLLGTGEAQVTPWPVEAGVHRNVGAVSPTRKTPETTCTGRRLVVGDGMIGRFDTERRETWTSPKPVFMPTVGRRAGGPGVRALIVALKPGNSGGAKGCRKVETQ